MKHFLYILTFLFIANSSVAQGYKIYKGDTVNRKDENGFKQGKWVIYNSVKKLPGYRPEQVVEVGKYKNNRKEGIWITYYPNGKKKNELTYKRNMPNGHAKFYYKTGIMSEEGTWVNNKWSGSYKYFYKNGNPMYQFNYVAGKRQGTQKYFHENGKVKIEGDWTNGKEEGTIRVYDDKGTLISEKVFENGVINKELTKTYDKPDDKKVIVNKPIVKKDTLENVKEVTVAETEDKKLEVIVKENEEPKVIGYFTGEGNYVLKNKNGQVKSEGFFKNGNVYNGKEYLYSGFQLAKTIVYKNGKIVKTIDNMKE